MNKEISNRFGYIDIMKFLGIFAIYIGHWGEESGRLYSFVFTYHIELFFTVSGFFAVSTIKHHPGLFDYIKYKSLKLLLPWLVYSLMNCIYYTLNENGSPVTLLVKYLSAKKASGIGGLWFIPCLFGVSICYYFLYKFIKNGYVMLVVSVLLFYINTEFRVPGHLIFNIDLLLHYLLFFTIGSMMYPVLQKISLRSFMDNRFISIATFLSAVIVGILLYFKELEWFMRLLPIRSDIINIYLPVLIALILIYLNFVVARLLEAAGFKLLEDMGKETLFFCGIENIIRNLFLLVFIVIGLGEPNVVTPIAAVIYSWVLMFVSYKFILPLLQNMKSTVMRP